MLKKLFKTLLLAVLLILLALLCWAVVLYAGWSSWWTVVLFIGLLLFGWLIYWLRRRFIAWRIRRRAARATDGGKGAARLRLIALDRRWREGLSMIRRSRLRKRGGFYALPWYLVLGPAGACKSTLLARSGLSSSFSPVSARAEVAPTSILDWWFFDRAILIEPAGRMVDPNAEDHQPGEWRRLLDHLARTRRREPLNGVVLMLPAEPLLGKDAGELADLGKALRSRLDQLTTVFSARIPVYIIISQADVLPGFKEWAHALPEPLRRQPFGHLVNDRERDAADFLRLVFEGIYNRLGELRIQQGLRAQPAPGAVFFPQHLESLHAALEHVLTPAFDATPYSEVPMLRGFFLASEAQEEDGLGAWFVHDVFDRVLPAERHSAQLVDRWRYWRRPLTHGAAVAWLLACVAIGALMTYAFRSSAELLDSFKWKNPAALNFSGGFSMDMSAFVELQEMIETIDAHNNAWYTWFLPWSADLVRVDQRFKRIFTTRFQTEALAKGADRLVAEGLPHAISNHRGVEVAALAELLVRRINLINAALAHQPLGRLPLPGRGFMVLVEDSDFPTGDFNAQAAARFGELYRQYVRWQVPRNVLATSVLTLRAQLNQLLRANQDLGWVIAWAGMQDGLPAVTMGDFLPVDNPSGLASVPAAYTAAGRAAIENFLDQMERTSSDASAWERWRASFEAQYRQQRDDAWFNFVSAVPSALGSLAGQPEWNVVLTELFTAQDPFFAVLDSVSQAFQGVKKAPAWVGLARELDQMVIAARSRTNPGSSALGLARAVDEMGGEALQQWVHGNKLASGISGILNERDASTLFLSYRSTVQGVIKDILKGPAHAYAVAAKFQQFSNDAKIKKEPIHDARAVVDKIRDAIGSTGPRDSEIWQLFSSALPVVIGYGNRTSACSLQRRWETDVTSKVGGITDASLRVTVLYGDKGSVSSFVDKVANPFIEHDGTHYAARSTWGYSLPFNSAFFGFLHAVDVTGVRYAASKQQQTKAEKADQSAVQEAKTKLADVEKKIDALKKGLRGVVSVQAQPTNVNSGAKVLPHRTSLTMRCAQGGLALQNFNFPVEQSIAWTPQTCGDAVLNLDFGAFSVERRYSGQYGFVKFLRAFRDGSHVFQPSDFPPHQADLKNAGVNRIIVTFRAQGGDALVASVDQLNGLQAQEAALQQVTAAPEKVQPASGDNALVKMDRQLPVPQQIARCWQPDLPSPARKRTMASD